MRLLLEAGAIVDVMDKNSRTPLLWAAAILIQVAVVRMLLEKGADVDLKDNSGRTPLSHVEGSPALKDYEVRLMLLEEQNQKRLERSPSRA